MTAAGHFDVDTAAHPADEWSGWIVLVGIATLYIPTYVWAARTIWQTEDQAHGALILIVVLWILWGKRHEILASTMRPVPWIGWPCAAFGLFLYILGKSQSISILEIGSQIPVLVGTVLILKGKDELRVLWFPLLFLVFMVPLPDTLIDALTGPLKSWISSIVETVLYHLGFPIAKQGVIIAIGPYQLQIADACSGLHSMYSLSALGVLFMYLTKRPSIVHNLLLAASILPIAFVANLIRVVLLVLITYYFGDEAGQGLLHGAAGILLMILATASLFLLDALLGKLTGRRAAVS